jgi:hypothetical protein
MASSVFPAPSAGGKTMFRTSLFSGTSWTVPAGVTYVNVTLMGGSGGGDSFSTSVAQPGGPGQLIHSTLSTTPGASIAYSIGAGGNGGASGGGAGGNGGTTTFTGATSAGGGNRGNGGRAATDYAGYNVGGLGGYNPGGQQVGGGAGGAGRIDIEYWA